MHRGYTKRWRKRWDKGYHNDFLLWVLMDYFIDFAAYKEKEVYQKRIGLIKLKRGQWYYTTRTIANFFDVDPRQIRTRVDTLEKLNFLTREVTRKYTIVSVINYDVYQTEDIITDTLIDTHETHTRHTIDTPFIAKKVNKVKKVKETTYSVDFETFWKTYPKRIGKDAAFTAWNKRNGNRPTIEAIVSKIQELKQTDQWRKENGQYIPLPTTWLNQGRWSDECKVEIKSNKPKGFSMEELHAIADAGRKPRGI